MLLMLMTIESKNLVAIMIVINSALLFVPCMSSGLRLTLGAVFSLPPNHSSAVTVASHSTLVGGNISS